MRKAVYRHWPGEAFSFRLDPRPLMPANDNDPFEPPPAASAGLTRILSDPLGPLTVVARAA